MTFFILLLHVQQVAKVKNVIIWGNHSSTQYPDAAHATVEVNGTTKPIPEAVKDEPWLNQVFVETIQKRGAAVIAARKMSSAMSAAKAAGDHMRDWWLGTKPGHFVSMGVVSDGSYSIPKDIVFSLPVTIENKQYKIVQVSNLHFELECNLKKGSVCMILSCIFLGAEYFQFRKIKVRRNCQRAGGGTGRG